VIPVARSLGFIVLGFGIGIGFMAALDLIGTGYRVDEQGTAPTTFDGVFGWGGLLAGSILMLVGAIVTASARNTSVFRNN
jgi:hypothetical protein